MLGLLTLAVTIAGFSTGVLGQVPSENITISPLPPFLTCQLATISWTGGRAPYRAYIYPAGWTNQSQWIVELPLTTRQQTSWNVNLEAGSEIVVNVWDGVNDEYSDPATIQDSGDISCLGFNGTMQSSAVSQPVPTSASLPTTRPSVVSTPSAPATPTSTPAQSSEGGNPSSGTSTSAPPPTVTVVEGNAAFPAHTIVGRWTLVTISAAIALFTWL